MSNRAKHRRAALARRVDRVAQDPNLPADPSNRSRKPKATLNCVWNCGNMFRTQKAWLIHAELRMCGR